MRHVIGIGMGLMGVGLWGCVARSVPSDFPSVSAASAESAPGEAHVVTRALSEEPPLPGEPREGWEGLEEVPAEDPHAHHHHHGHHGAGQDTAQPDTSQPDTSQPHTSQGAQP